MQQDNFKVIAEQFADIRILRYQVPGFDQLDIRNKKLLYYLYEAALCGRDIIYDQNYRYNLIIRHTLEHIINNYDGDRSTDDWKKFTEYTKRVWFSNGIHHHYSMEKFVPEITKIYFEGLLQNAGYAEFMRVFGSLDQFIQKIVPLIFDKSLHGKRVVQDADTDLIQGSANNFYENVTQEEVEAFYAKMTDINDKKPVSHGLNSKLLKEGNVLVEKVWKVGGMYSEAITRIVTWLEKAVAVAGSSEQKASLEKLIEYYKTGDLKTFDDYSIHWLKDTGTEVDVINGFIEVYGDPLGRKATYESVVSVEDKAATRRAKTISDNAQWFEDNSPVASVYKKSQVKGVSAKGINVVVESGDCSPASPIGINLPNADWIREEYGSKSVTINNIMTAYDEASRESGAIEEFAWSEEDVELSKKWGNLSTLLHVDLHEIVGHGSGKLKEGVGNPSDTLKNYASTIEEARADLFALYFATDEKLVELGLMPKTEVGIAEYNSYIRGGLLTQLVRIEPGKNIEESHMRNRQLIAKWVYEKGNPENIIEKKTREGKTFFVVNDHDRLRLLFGELLREVQRIKSEGDYEAAKHLVEHYGVKVDQQIHKEMLQRWKALDIPPFSGFINPRLVPVFENGKISEVKIEYPENFGGQMMEYAEKYSFLPVFNG
jgi:dipeptidyl-peptidase III